MSVLVLGIGNILLGDEGIGVRVVEALLARFRFPEDVQVVDGGTAGMGLLDLIAGQSHVIIVDAVINGAAPGSIVRLEGDDVPIGFRQRTSPHSLGLGDVLALLTVLDQAPQQIVVIGIEPAEMDYRIGLSTVVTSRLDVLVDAVIGELTHLGLPPQAMLPIGADEPPVQN